MSRRCFVDGCRSNDSRDYNLRFFAFPQGKDALIKQRIWLKEIEKGTGKKIDIRKFKPSSSRVCELHFTKSNFIPERCVDGSIFMKRDPESIPSVFESSRLLVDEITLKKCRICLKTEGTVYIHDCLPKSDVTIIEAVKKTFNFSFYSQSHFPPNICTRCYNFVVAAHVLKLEILKSDATLRSIAAELAEVLRSQMQPLPPEVPQVLQPAPQQEVENVVFMIKELGDDEIKQEPVDQSDDTAYDGNYEENEFEQNFSDTNEQNSRDECQMDYEHPQNDQFKAFEETSNEGDKSNLVTDPLDVSQMIAEATQAKSQEPGESSKQSSRFYCKNCGHKAKEPFELRDHLDKSTQSCIKFYRPKFECFICRKKFMLKSSKYRHIKAEHRDNELTGECPHCRKFHENLKNRFLYERHLRFHAIQPSQTIKSVSTFQNQNKDLQFSCDFCNFKGSTRNSIYGHMKKHGNFKRVGDPHN